MYLRHRLSLQAQAQHPPPPSKGDRQALFKRCAETVNDPEHYLRLWFLGAPTANIKRLSVKEFYLWSFFNKGGPPGEDNSELDQYVTATEDMLGREIEPGRGEAECLRLTIDRVHTMHRPLIWYLIVGFVDTITFCRLRYYGFQFSRTSLSSLLKLFPMRPVALLAQHRSPAAGLSYWYRPHTSSNELPVLFIHGIGIGLHPYVDFLADLNRASGTSDRRTRKPNEQVGIIALEIMPISFRLTSPIPTKDELCTQIQCILAYHGWADHTLVSDSYGTAISTYLLKDPRTSPQINSLVLIDPITFLLHLPDVAYNFTRRQPIQANEHQLYYFASMDPGVAHSLGRMFSWSECILWKEELEGRRLTVSLAERDLIVNTDAVKRYLAGDSSEQCEADGYSDDIPSDTHPEESLLNASVSSSSRVLWRAKPWSGKGLDVIWHQGTDHAQVFESRDIYGRLVEIIREYCRTREPKGHNLAGSR
ncbi:hypothetical protein LTS00_017388 [Friedmanniomyces endolithicus]|nr:hypothetical protein LTS00_017388 [Friedmanniomyces endolithicus]